MASVVAARRHVTSRARALATALTALALVLRLVLPMAPMPANAAAPDASIDAWAELLAGGGICHGDPDAAARPGDAAPGKSAVSCLLCPFCTGPAPLLTAMPTPLKLPTAVLIAAAVVLPPATAPPSATYRHARPRGPPALSA